MKATPYRPPPPTWRRGLIPIKHRHTPIKRGQQARALSNQPWARGLPLTESGATPQ